MEFFIDYFKILHIFRNDDSYYSCHREENEIFRGDPLLIMDSHEVLCTSRNCIGSEYRWRNFEWKGL